MFSPRISIKFKRFRVKLLYTKDIKKYKTADIRTHSVSNRITQGKGGTSTVWERSRQRHGNSAPLAEW